MTRSRPAAVAGRTVALTIEALGEAGDGIARHEGARRFVPLGLPGERWTARLLGADRASPLERLEGGERASAACAHFGSCGGCALQHMPEPVYAGFKRDRIMAALVRVGLGDRFVAPARRSPPGSRRRVRLAWRRAGGRILLGYRARGAATIVPVLACPVALPALVALFTPCAGLLAGLRGCGREGEVTGSVTDSGVDIVLDGVTPDGVDDLERLATFAQHHDLARLAVRSPSGLMPIAERRAPRLRFGDVAVLVPEGAFLQATREGEAALQGAVGEWLAEAPSLVDLFAGLGTLSLPWARHRRLALFEADAGSVGAVERALRAAGPIAATVARRDLERSPLAADEFAPFAAAILDPPRGGAAAQSAELARSAVPRLVYASCHPGSFARDARILENGGLRLREVRPVDQFLWSPEVELIALFTR